MTQKKLRMVRAKLFSACLARRGSCNEDEICSVRTPRLAFRAGRMCRRKISHATLARAA